MDRFKRTLYIGIGGAGIDTLTVLKSKLTSIVDKSSQISSIANPEKKEVILPRQVRFLCIDTNSTELLNRTAFSDDEKICVSVRDPYGRYNREKDSSTFEFIPTKNAKHISALDRGAGQIRSNGHFAIIESQFLGVLTRKLRMLANDMREVTIPGETVLQDTKIEVHLVFSLCGGTGSGMFLPVSLLVREAIKNCEITGYMYSPTFFVHDVEDSAKDMVVQNAYAAIAELDYCMHFGYENNQPITYSFGPSKNDKISMKARPFNEVMFVDKQTFVGTNGAMEYTYLSLENAQELTAEMMLLSATDVMTAHVGVMDNVRQKVAQGQFNVRDKFGWVMGFGLSELYIKGNDVLSVSSEERTLKFLADFDTPNDGNESESAGTIAYDWLGELNLNETGVEGDDHDELINAIYDKGTNLRRFNLDDLDDVPNLIDMYDAIKKYDIEKRDEVEKDRLDRLKEKVDDSVQKKVSFGDLVSILKEFKKLLNKCTQQLQSEIEGHEKDIKKLGDIDASEFPSRTRKERVFFGLFDREVPNEDFNGGRTIFTQKAKEKVYRYAELKCDIDRKNNAIGIYTSLSKLVQDEINLFENRATRLKNIIKVGRQTLKQTKDTQASHVGNLSDAEAHKASNRIDVTAQADFLDIPNPITIESVLYYLDDVSCNEGTAFSKLNNIVISAILNGKGNEDGSLLIRVIEGYDEKHPVLQNLLKNSAPLISFDFHGESLPVDEFDYIVGNKEVCDILKQKLERLYPRKFTVIPVEGMNYSVMVYRIVGAVPPYYVNGIAESTDPLSMEHVYEVAKMHNHTYTPFSHSKLQKLLENRYAVLKPIDEVEDSKVMDTWINFIIYGYIKRTDGSTDGTRRYWIESDSSGERLTDNLQHREKILVLGENRSDAFETFRRYCANLLDDYDDQYRKEQEKQERIVNEEGQVVYVADVTSEKYLKEGLCLISVTELNRLHKEDDDFKLLEKEVAHIDKRYSLIKEKIHKHSLIDEIINKKEE